MIMNRRKGVAIAVVLVFCTAILGLLTVLMMNSRHQRGSYSMQYDQTRALMAARSGIQLAIYKYRVLPSEYYRIHQMALDVKAGAPPDEFNTTRDMWLYDLKSENADTPAAKIKAHLDISAGGGPDAVAAGSFEFGVEEFDLVSRSLHGYTQDYLRVRAWGSFRGTRKTMEELIEVKIAQ
ncbi:MAG: hypothetical protein A2W80_04410 [Candidatus Riflebacteria bacterium GWC2_50_8]|nr:MAG: hypothetical protein A2W80_04410 [Candidatus Riflebacteria bacterium GWC2_50_8]